MGVCARFFLVYLGHLLQRNGELSMLKKESIDHSRLVLGEELISLYLACFSLGSVGVVKQGGRSVPRRNPSRVESNAVLRA